ncbi:MAG: hypothetical protein PHQ60_02465 [Sideroxydans sp.]|nr:hypothetical protein [Sideroxydans sp.]
MYQYDPESTPNSEEWLALDEQERIILVEDFHEAARIKLPNLTAHAAFHAVVENQIAEGLESVLRAMERLAKQGLTRHDSIHAIVYVLVSHINDLFNSKDDAATSQARYNAAVERITEKNWRKL